MISTTMRSLRSMVERWLSPESAKQVHVTQFTKKRSLKRCYVCVETFKSTGAVTMFFFRHQDGTWQVFPPGRDSPMMQVEH